MKKLDYIIALIVFLFLLIVPGCIYIGTNTNTKSDISEEVILAEQRAKGTLFNRIYEFEYNGHQYIQFVNGYYDANRSDCGHKVAGIVHNPDCPCKKYTK